MGEVKTKVCHIGNLASQLDVNGRLAHNRFHIKT